MVCWLGGLVSVLLQHFWGVKVRPLYLARNASVKGVRPVPFLPANGVNVASSRDVSN